MIKPWTCQRQACLQDWPLASSLEKVSERDNKIVLYAWGLGPHRPIKPYKFILTIWFLVNACFSPGIERDWSLCSWEYWTWTLADMITPQSNPWALRHGLASLLGKGATCAFSFADFCVYPFEVNHNHK